MLKAWALVTGQSLTNFLHYGKLLNPQSLIFSHIIQCMAMGKSKGLLEATGPVLMPRR